MVLRGDGPILRKTIIETEALKRIMLKGIPLYIPTNSGWTAAVTGSGTTSQLVPYNEVGSGTTTGSTSRLYLTDFMLGATNTGTDFSKRILWGFSIRRNTSDASIIARVQMKAATTEGALAGAGFGIRMANLTLTGESYGTAGAFTATIQAMTADSIYYVMVDHEPAVPRIRFYVNGALQATVTVAGNQPTAVVVSCALLHSILNGAGTANGLFEVGNIFVLQEH